MEKKTTQPKIKLMSRQEHEVYAFAHLLTPQKAIGVRGCYESIWGGREGQKKKKKNLSMES